MIDLNKFQKEVHQNAKDHGWWDEERSFPELLMLIVSEAAEALEEYRNNNDINNSYYSGKGKTHWDSQRITVTTLYTSEKPRPDLPSEKPEGIPSELADIVLRVMDICGHYNIDLESAIRKKHEYNKTRPYKHGGKRI
jgi:hypothetical protein